MLAARTSEDGGHGDDDGSEGSESFGQIPPKMGKPLERSKVESRVWG